VVIASGSGCGGVQAPATSDAGSAIATGTAGAAEGVGDPCVPQQESSPSFLGFDEKELSIETRSPSCKTGVCLANHFRGRVSCPYGQSVTGDKPTGAKTSCLLPGTTEPVSGLTDPALPSDFSDPRRKAFVAPQCVDRAAEKTVYCSCRCANAEGRTDDGATYCGCGDGFECASLVKALGKSANDIAGSYCVKKGTAYSADTACSEGDCDPIARVCP
jgi:hypothetical protein